MRDIHSTDINFVILLQIPIRRHHRVVTIQKVVERTAENQGKQARRLHDLGRERGPTSVVNTNLNLVEGKEEWPKV